MFHPLNGRNNYSLLLPPKDWTSRAPLADPSKDEAADPVQPGELDDVRPAPQIMAAMLRREEELRLGPETQQAYAAGEEDMLDYLLALQKRVVREFGYPETHVHLLRGAGALYSRSELPADRLPFYIRYNRSHQGILRARDCVVDVPLISVTLSGQACESSLISHLAAK